MKANYHTHTVRCKHATGEDREYVEAAIKAGLKVLGFSDHCPWIYDDGYISGTRMLPSQLDDYFKSLIDLKKEYESDIKILIGFESEYIPELMEAQDRLLAGYPVDYQILGEHFTEREPFSAYTGFPSDDEMYLKKYVDLIIEGMETGRYVYIAHPDLLNFTGSAEIFEKHYSRLCRYLSEKDIPVEINLLGVRDGRHYTSEKFLEIARKAGNKVIIGCDAHYPSALYEPEPIKKCTALADKFGLEIVDYLNGLGE